ncbi:hypothetical protein pb186bvf_010081 [Paramecium bursaria]
MQLITPEIVREFKVPQKNFLCPPTKEIKFTRFVIRDVDTDFTLFEFNTDKNDDIQQEVISYQFEPEYFDIKAIGTTKVFTTGPKPLKNLIMIENFYFKDRIIKQYEFRFPFCIPDSTNSWESIYDLPALGENLKSQMILNPWETRSDTFLFIDNVFSLHMRAEYDYSGGQQDFD